MATLVNLAYTALEAGFGFHANSLALLSDALHNLGDVLGLALAWGAAVLAQRAPTGRHTYGWRRATLLSPLANALMLVGFAGALMWEVAAPLRRAARGSRRHRDGRGRARHPVNLGTARCFIGGQSHRPQPARRLPAPAGRRGVSLSPRSWPAWAC